ncbi:transglycosylase SLT domain-containing protein [Paraburkholderia sp. J67]|uniref:transglycosylase SLT domain-containing protein n=1 Tax=Paraburkholderia sp. J67 TaxID=2805435 RepID=UPI002ABD7F50|nr:transglycosylase SLT domain-containing protein [Paraburkholderia sp. J67]
MTTKKKLVKKQTAQLTKRSDTEPVAVSIDDSARLREIREIVKANNHSTLSDDLIVCQVYMESRFDAQASTSGSTAKGLMQMTATATKQVYKERLKKDLGHTPSDKQSQEAFHDAAAFHSTPQIFDEATNIQLGTEYMQYWVEKNSTVEDAYKGYRGLSNGIYYQKINACATKLKDDPDSMQPLRDMVK